MAKKRQNRRGTGARSGDAGLSGAQLESMQSEGKGETRKKKKKKRKKNRKRSDAELDHTHIERT